MFNHVRNRLDIHFMFQDVRRTNNGYEDVFYLQMMDINGTYHNVGRGDNCDKYYPQMMSDTIEITNHALLPIRAVRYGPMK